MILLKLYIILLILLSSIVTYSQDSHCSFGEIDTIEGICEIKKIKKSPNNTGYVIYAEAERNDSKLIFVIVSTKNKGNNNNEKIKTNKQYYFNLHSYHPHKTDEGYRYLPYLVDYQEVFVNYRKIIINKTHYYGEVYTTPDLHGLYYCPSQKK